MRVAVHQPNFMPFYGFFHKMSTVDLFIYYDDCQYEKQDFTNRVKIKTSEGARWLTIPVVNTPHHKLIRETRLADYPTTYKTVMKTLAHSYSKARNFDRIYAEIKLAMSQDFEYLIDLNLSLLTVLRDLMNIDTPVRMASEFCIDEIGTTKILGLMKSVGGTVYKAGGLGYDRHMKRVEEFVSAGVKLLPTRYVEPQYEQLYGDYVHNLSIIDYLMNRDE